DFRFCIVPTSKQIAAEFLIGARPLHLIENEFVIFFDRFDDLSELTHTISPSLGCRGACAKRLSLGSAFDTNAATTLFARLAQTRGRRQSRGAVLQPYRPVAGLAR